MGVGISSACCYKQGKVLGVSRIKCLVVVSRMIGVGMSRIFHKCLQPQAGSEGLDAFTDKVLPSGQQ